MAKAKKKVVKIGGIELKDTAPPKLTAGDYWRMRAYAEALEHDKTKVRLAEAMDRLHLTEGLLAHAKRKLADWTIKDENSNVVQSTADYNEVIKEIELSVGRTLSNCSINPETYEIMEEPHGAS